MYCLEVAVGWYILFVGGCYVLLFVGWFVIVVLSFEDSVDWYCAFGGLVIFVLVVLMLVGVACNFVVLLCGLIVCGVCL